MSRENVELHHRAVDVFNRRDLDGFLALMDEDVQTESRIAPMEGGYRGHDGARRWWDAIREAFPEFTTEIEEVHDRGDFTVAVLHNRVRWTDSPTPLEERLWQAAEWRDNKLVWWSTHPTEAEALEAVRLRE